MAFYPAIPASDGTSMMPPAEAPFEVFELFDTARENPLTLESESGLNAAPLVTTGQGVVPPVNVISPNFSHIFKSGEWEWRRDSFDAAEQATRQSAADAQDARLAAEDAARTAVAPAHEAVVDALTRDGSPARELLASEVTAAAAGKLSRDEAAEEYVAKGETIRIDAPAEAGRRNLLQLADSAAHDGHLLDMGHYGNGSTGTSTQTYGLNIRNYPGARQALVIHQYSDAANGAAVHIDNTATQPAFRVWNTENQNLNPGSSGTGAFFQLRPWQSPGYFHFTNDLVFENKTQYGMVARVPIDGRAVTAFTVDQQQEQVALQVNQTGGNFWGAQIVSTGSFGAIIKASGASGGQTLTVEREAVGGVGEAIRITNKGSGDSLAIRNASAQVAKIASTGEYENMVAGAGIILRAPNSARYRIAVSNTGTLTAVAI